MAKSRYNIKEINIGDSITYKYKYSEYKFSTWKVVGKLDKTLLVVEKIENDIIERRLIDITDVETLRNP